VLNVEQWWEETVPSVHAWASWLYTRTLVAMYGEYYGIVLGIEARPSGEPPRALGSPELAPVAHSLAQKTSKMPRTARLRAWYMDCSRGEE
jgi:hypothetical protein